MASVGESLLIFLGLDSSNLEKGLKDAETKTKDSVNRTAQSLDQMAGKWRATVGGIVRMVAAPLAGALSTGAMIKSYFGDVAEVARLTGAYSSKLEEWRKKRAMLARVNKEDIQLYIKGREAVTKFQIVMSDLSATFMRKLSPAFKWAIEKLNQFSDWIDRNQDNIIRFATVLAAVISGVLTPAFAKLALAILANPITWIVAGITALALVIDDLITYLQGGESIIGHYWDPLINGAKVVHEWALKLWETFKQTAVFDNLVNTFNAVKDTALEVFDYIKTAVLAVWDAVVTLFGYLEGAGAFDALMRIAGGALDVIGNGFNVLLNIVKTVFGAIIAIFTGDTSMMSKAWEDLCGSFSKAFDSVGNFVSEVIDDILGAFRAVGDLVSRIFDFSGLFDKAKSAINSFKSWIGLGDDGEEVTVSDDNVDYTQPTRQRSRRALPAAQDTTEGLNAVPKRDDTWRTAYANVQNSTEGLNAAAAAQYSTISTSNSNSAVYDNKQVSVNVYPQTEAASRAAIDEAYGLGDYSALAAMGATR